MTENITRKLYRELDKMDEKYAAEQKEFSMADIELLDKITHTLKCLNAIEDGGMSRDGYSTRRGRDSMGRYTSRDMSREGESRGYYPEYERRGY